MTILLELLAYRSVRPLKSFGRIHRRSWLVRPHVRIGTRRILARQARKTGQVVVESIEPHGTIICGQGPLSNHDRTELTFHGRDHGFLAAGICVEADAAVWITPRLVNMSVERTLRATVHKTLDQCPQQVQWVSLR